MSGTAGVPTNVLAVDWRQHDVAPQLDSRYNAERLRLAQDHTAAVPQDNEKREPANLCRRVDGLAGCGAQHESIWQTGAAD